MRVKGWLIGVLGLALVVVALTTWQLKRVQAIHIIGTGASFPAPIYQQWAVDYGHRTGNQVQYLSANSGEGIANIRKGNVDFGASDVPLDSEQLARYGLMQFPGTIGGVVPIIHIDGVKNGQLKLTGLMLAQIFMGDISRWNDPRLVALNSQLNLPNLEISVIHRDGVSGTTSLFSSYLDEVSPEWHERFGVRKELQWSVGSGLMSSSGILGSVKSTNGAISYAAYTAAVEADMVMVRLQNHDGFFTVPALSTFRDAVDAVGWVSTHNGAVSFINQPGKLSWPITGASYVLVKKDAPQKKIQQVLAFFRWSYRYGQGDALSLNYVPVANSVVDRVMATWPDNAS